MKIGLLVIATGKYIEFVEPLWDSVKKYFLVGSKYDVKMFVFTDSKNVPKGTIRFYQKHEKFPYPTLMRYHIFLKHKRELGKMDYLYYCDADMKFVSPIGKEILGDLVAIMHPGFFDKERNQFPYETRKSSTAYVEPNKGAHYFCGGFNGGRSKFFLSMSETISKNIELDIKNGITATWHDESHLNRYLINHPPTVTLPPPYCYPEELSLPFKPKLLALSKNHATLRYSGLEAFYFQLKAMISQNIFALFIKIKSKINPLLLLFSMKFYLQFISLFYRRSFNKVFHINCENNVKKHSILDLVTIAFNNLSVIEIQSELLRIELKDNYFYTIADNSSDKIVQNKIFEFCRRKGIAYIRVPQISFLKVDPSVSHGLALIWVYKNYIRPRGTSYFGFLDHDIFPIRKTSIVKHLKRFPVYGLTQERGDKWYLWAGFCFFKKSRLHTLELDFLPRYGLDAGGGNWQMIYSFLNINKHEYVAHSYASIEKTNENIDNDQLVSSLLSKDCLAEYVGDWIHTFNASNWRKIGDKNRKVKHLLKNMANYDNH